MEEFIIAIREHFNIGYVPVAYKIKSQPQRDYYVIQESVTIAHTKAYASNFSPEEIKLVRLIEEYSDVNLMRKFSKNKKNVSSPNEFYKSSDKEMFDSHIRPYVERRIVQIIDILRNSEIRLFHKVDNLANVYLSDEIKIENQAAETVFNINRGKDKTRYHLSIFHQGNDISLYGKFGIIISNEPCRLILDKQLFYFDDIDGKKLQPFFIKQFIPIEQRAEKKWFEVFAQPAIKKYRVNTSGFEIKQLNPAKKASLTLQKNMNNKLVLVLQFHYGDRSFFPNYKAKDLVYFIERETSFYFEKLSHDIDWENDKLLAISQLGLEIDSFGNYCPSIFSTDIDFHNYELINWLNANTEAILKAGFIIEQNLDLEQFYLGKFNLNIKLQNIEKDWFDLYAVIEFDEFEIPFYKFKKHILHGNREFKLPNGKVFILPLEWFAKYADMMLFANSREKLIQLKAFHFNLIRERILETDKNILTSLKELANFNLPEKIDIPPAINAELRSYQKEGFFWMNLLQENNFGGCLADDMGLGKTLQTITLLSKIYNESSINLEIPNKNGQLSLFQTNAPIDTKTSKTKASLIVMPVSLIINWEKEFEKFNPKLKILKFVGSGRSKTVEVFDNYHIILASYGIVRNEFEMLRNYQFHYIILDESQYVKNSQSKVYKALLELNSSYKLVLTGTPIENSLTDLWSQMNFVNNGLLGSYNFFMKEYVKPIEKEQDLERQQKLQILIKPFIMRRTKELVAKDLPPVTEQILYCDMFEEQASFYEEEKSKVRNQILQNIEREGISNASFLAIQGLTRLRQIANHPILADEEKLFDSGKFDVVKNKLKTLISENHNVLIFSSFVKHLSLFEGYFKENNWKYSILTGKMSKEKRQIAIDNFQNDKETKLFLISIKAGGVGLNLTSADYVFILDPWWNPAVELQAINRAHRIGQDKNVFVYRFISNKTIEHKIRKLQEEKASLAEVFINSNNPFKDFDKEKLMDFFD